MVTFADLPPALVQRVRKLDFDVLVLHPLEFHSPARDRGYIAYCHPSPWEPAERGEVVVSSSTDPSWVPAALAHEIGHAEQWREHGVLWWNAQFRDPVLHFQCEMDAVERGRKLLPGPDMDDNYWGNYLGYMDRLGLAEMGRS